MSPLFKKGNRSGEPYFFIKGQTPWNKGKTYRVIPRDRWSFKYEFCKKCETKSHAGRQKHYSNGLCKSCYFKELSIKDGPEKQKIRSLRRRQKIKNDPQLHQQILMHQAEWRKTSRAYKKQFERKKKMMRFQKFIRVFFETNLPMKKYKKLLYIMVEHDGKEIKMPAPITHINRDISDLILFKKEVKKFLEKRVIHSMTVDKQVWKSL